jgi:hypothetical protein
MTLARAFQNVFRRAEVGQKEGPLSALIKPAMELS